MADWSIRPAEIQLGGKAFPTRPTTRITNWTVGDLTCSGKPTEENADCAGTRTTRRTNRIFTQGNTPTISLPRPTERAKRLRYSSRLLPITWGRFSLRSESWMPRPSQRRNWFTSWSNRTVKTAGTYQKVRGVKNLRVSYPQKPAFCCCCFIFCYLDDKSQQARELAVSQTSRSYATITMLYNVLRLFTNDFGTKYNSKRVFFRTHIFFIQK